MEIILAILLHLNVIQSGGVYTTSQLQELKLRNEVQIRNVMLSPTEMNSIMLKESRELNSITVIDDAVID